MKDVVVAVRSSPLTTGRVHEALRMALGLTLSNHQVTVAYMGDGATAALQMEGTILMRPGLEDSLELFEACRIREVVELESVPKLIERRFGSELSRWRALRWWNG